MRDSESFPGLVTSDEREDMEALYDSLDTAVSSYNAAHCLQVESLDFRAACPCGSCFRGCIVVRDRTEEVV